MKNVFFISHDTGGANAISPIYEKLKTKSGIKLTYCGLGPSRKVLDNKKITNLAPPSDHNWSEVEKLLSTSTPHLVITGRSGENEFERRALLWAQQNDVPSFTVLDYWGNYLESFLINGKLVLPNWISVTDNITKQEMIKLGFPGEIIAVLGNPYLDWVIQRKHRKSVDKVAKIDKDKFVLLFLSQPISIAGKNYGYDERVVIKDLCRIINKLENTYGICELWVRPHPRDNIDGIKKLLAEHANGLTFCIDQYKDGYRAIISADVVIGMMTIMLIESALMGKTTVSYQPGLLEPDICVSNWLGLSKDIRDFTELQKYLHLLVQRHKDVSKVKDISVKNLPPTMDGHSTERNVNKVMEILAVADQQSLLSS